MGFIKIIFWFTVAVILAYFMTDIKIGGKTIKENIDVFLASDSGQTISNKGKNLLNQVLQGSLNKLNQNDIQQLKQELAHTQEISQQDMDRIKKLIEESQAGKP